MRYQFQPSAFSLRSRYSSEVGSGAHCKNICRMANAYSHKSLGSEDYSPPHWRHYFIIPCVQPAALAYYSCSRSRIVPTAPLREHSTRGKIGRHFKHLFKILVWPIFKYRYQRDVILLQFTSNGTKSVCCLPPKYLMNLDTVILFNESDVWKLSR